MKKWMLITLFTSLCIQQASYAVGDSPSSQAINQPTEQPKEESWFEKHKKKLLIAAAVAAAILGVGTAALAWRRRVKEDDIQPSGRDRSQELDSDVRVLELGDEAFFRDPTLIKELKKFPNLESLCLSKTGLKELPASIGELSQLKWLGLPANELTNPTEEINKLAGLSNLELFDLSETGINELPGWITQLKRLSTLILAGNKLTELPESIGNLISLTELDLYKNRLTTLPDSIGNLTSLTELNLAKNHLKELPDSIVKLTGLRVLNLAGIFLPEAEINRLTVLQNLETLFLSLDQLTNLQSLANELREKLPKLKDLRFFQKQVSEKERDEIRKSLLGQAGVYFTEDR